MRKASDMTWDAARYDQSYDYVAGYGAPLLDLLDPRQGERVIDLGCGTGTLTEQIAARGAEVLGLDADPNMIAVAQAKHARPRFERADAHEFSVPNQADAVFSNAALHWMTEPRRVLLSVRRALRPGGRFIGEMGAAGNCATLIEGLRSAAAEAGLGPGLPLPWYFPTPAEYTTLLEQAGFTVRLLQYFERPTPLSPDSNGAAGWWQMFGPAVLRGYPEFAIGQLLERVNEITRAALVHDGTWYADYVRLRFVAETRQ